VRTSAKDSSFPRRRSERRNDGSFAGTACRYAPEIEWHARTVPWAASCGAGRRRLAACRGVPAAWRSTRVKGFEMDLSRVRADLQALSWYSTAVSPNRTRPWPGEAGRARGAVAGSAAGEWVRGAEGAGGVGRERANGWGVQGPGAMAGTEAAVAGLVAWTTGARGMPRR